MRCDKCSEPITGSGQYCSKCGQQVIAMPLAPTERKKTQWWWFIVVPVALLALLVAVPLAVVVLVDRDPGGEKKLEAYKKQLAESPEGKKYNREQIDAQSKARSATTTTPKDTDATFGYGDWVYARQITVCSPTAEAVRQVLDERPSESAVRNALVVTGSRILKPGTVMRVTDIGIMTSTLKTSENGLPCWVPREDVTHQEPPKPEGKSQGK